MPVKFINASEATNTSGTDLDTSVPVMFLSTRLQNTPFNKTKRLDWWNLSDSMLSGFILKIAKYHATKECQDNGPDYDRLVHDYQRDFQQTIKELRKLQATSDSKKRKSLTKGIFHRPYAARVAVMFAAYYVGQKYKRPDIGGSLPKKTIITRSENWGNPKVAEPDPQCRWKTKHNGTFRKFWRFGPIRYSQQVLLKWILASLRPLPVFDFAIPGRGGHDAAVEAMGIYLESGQCPIWAHVDLKNAFPSITRSMVRHLFDLDDWLVRYIAVPTLNTFQTNKEGYRENLAHQKALRPELPQGGAHSSLILSAVVDGILGFLPEGDMMAKVVFADNIHIGARTVSEARCALSALDAATSKFSQTAGSETGGLTLHDHEVFNGMGKKEQSDRAVIVDGIRHSDSIDTLGYKFHLDAFGEGVKFRPGSKQWRRFWEEVFELWKENPHFTDEKLIEIAENKRDNWRHGFKHWTIHHNKEAALLSKGIFRTSTLEKIEEYRSVYGFERFDVCATDFESEASFKTGH